MTTFDDHNITVVGELEMKQLAARFRERFAPILDNEKSQFYARGAINRTQATIHHFLDEFFKNNKTIQPDLEFIRKDTLLDFASSCKKYKVHII
jgi:hypothetical protein